MENKVPYGFNTTIRPSALTAYSAEWDHPSPTEIKIAMQAAGWRAVDFHKAIGVNDRTVRRWLSGDKPMAYATWCVLCSQAGYGDIWKHVFLKANKENIL